MKIRFGMLAVACLSIPAAPTNKIRHFSMMKVRCVMLAGLLLGVSPNAANAGPSAPLPVPGVVGDYSANSYMPACRAFISGDTSTTTMYQIGQCVGLVQGVSAMDRDACVPKTVSLGQMVRVVVQYIDSRPARMHEYFVFLTSEALHTAWPCR